MEPKVLYSVLIIVRYSTSNFVMLGCQFAFSFDNYNGDYSFNQLKQNINIRLKLLLDNYGIYNEDLNVM
jgi:hypothetical protein